MLNIIYERPPKPPTFWSSYTRTLILDTIMKLSGTIGVTQKTMTLDTHVRLILLQTLNPQERWGTHKKRWPFQPRPFADVIGLVRCSYIYIYLYCYTMDSCAPMQIYPLWSPDLIRIWSSRIGPSLSGREGKPDGKQSWRIREICGCQGGLDQLLTFARILLEGSDSRSNHLPQ